MPLRVILSDAEVEIRDRAHMLWLNHDGWNVPAIADMFDCQEATVRATIRRWEVGNTWMNRDFASGVRSAIATARWGNRTGWSKLNPSMAGGSAF